MRRNAVWALTRIDDPFARHVVTVADADPDDSVKMAAAHSMSLWRDAQALPILFGDVSPVSSHAQHRRIAAEALGRIGDKRAVPLLVQSAKTLDVAPDRILEHSLIFALIEIADSEQ